MSENGIRFLDGRVRTGEQLDDEVCRRPTQDLRSDFDSGFLHMTYRVIPGPNYDDDPAVTQVCGVVHRDDIEQAWACEGELRWHPVAPESLLPLRRHHRHARETAGRPL